jgi:hypothetical protein
MNTHTGFSKEAALDAEGLKARAASREVRRDRLLDSAIEHGARGNHSRGNRASALSEKMWRAGMKDRKAGHSAAVDEAMTAFRRGTPASPKGFPRVSRKALLAGTAAAGVGAVGAYAWLNSRKKEAEEVMSTHIGFAKEAGIKRTLRIGDSLLRKAPDIVTKFPLKDSPGAVRYQMVKGVRRLHEAGERAMAKVQRRVARTPEGDLSWSAGHKKPTEAYWAKHKGKFEPLIKGIVDGTKGSS